MAIAVTGSSIVVGLYGYLEKPGTELDVVSKQPGVTTAPRAVLGDSREWVISSTISGTARIEARTKAGAVWDWIEVTFMAMPSAHLRSSNVSDADRAEVFKAARDGRILKVGAQIQAVEKKGYFESNGRRILLADAMFATLAALARQDTLSLLSMMRFGEGFHGRPVAEDTAICSAMDIDRFGQYSINLINGDNADNTISGVAAVIEALPPGEFALGLTRPSKAARGAPMPDKDVFLPMKTMADMYKVGFPLANPTPRFCNADAASAVNRALQNNPQARMNRMFEDGVDHLHLEVLSANSPS
jgi:hypothetical protein